MEALAPDSVSSAAARIAPWVTRTPVVTSGTFDALAGRAVHFKCENLQKTGSFKYRGATNAVRRLPADVAARGVVTHSSGNHAQALALAAKLRGVPAHIVMPRTAAAVKRDAVLGYGGRVVDCEPTLSERERVAAEIVAETGGTLIPPFDHVDVIAGQGTCGLELLADVPHLDALVVPVGGGGLISGVSLAARLVNPRVRVFGAEPLAANDAARSKAAGVRQSQPTPDTVADGLMTTLGDLTWPIVRDHVERVFTPDEASIVSAMRLVWERLKLVIEPSAAVGVAVVLSDEFRAVEGVNSVGVILCGGNVDLGRRYW